jgi:hypothetical protein
MSRTYLVPLVLFIFLALYGCIEHQGASVGMDALKAGDISKCKTLREPSDINECYYTFADGKNDPKYCLQAPDPSACVSDYAGKRQQMSACDVLTDPAQKYSCVARVAGDQTGRSIEEMVADFRTRGASKKCLEACTAKEEKDKLPCELNKKYIPPYEQNGMIIVPVDTEYVGCINRAKDAYISCREDCLQGGGDPYFHN